jgi:hypothetical protein
MSMGKERGRSARRGSRKRETWSRGDWIAFFTFVIGTPVAIVACYAGLAAIPDEYKPYWASVIVKKLAPPSNTAVKGTPSQTSIGGPGPPAAQMILPQKGNGVVPKAPIGDPKEFSTKIDALRGKYESVATSCEALDDCLVNICKLHPEYRNDEAIRRIGESIDNARGNLNSTNSESIHRRLRSIESEVDELKKRCQLLPSCCIH